MGFLAFGGVLGLTSFIRPTLEGSAMVAFRRRRPFIFLILALIFLASTLILYVGSSPFWWYGFYLTAIAGAASLRAPPSQHSFTASGLLFFYLASVFMGIGVEAVRIFFDLWHYTPILNGIAGVAGFVLVGYFLMMFAMAMVYEQAILRVKAWPPGAILLFALLILPVEIANRFVPVWEEPNFPWVYLLFGVGYAIEAIVAVLVFRAAFRPKGGEAHRL